MSGAAKHDGAMTVHINTLDYANDLPCKKSWEKAGIVRAHAEAIAQLQARTVRDLVDNELVTKADLTVFRAEFKADLAVLRAEVKSDLKIEIAASADGLRQELRREVDGVNRRIDGIQVQLRSLQFGGAIAAFIISAVVLLTRFIR